MNHEFNYENGMNELPEVVTYNQKTKKVNRVAKKVGALVLSGAILGTTAGGAFAASSYFFPHNTATQNITQSKTNSVSNTTLTSFQNSSSRNLTRRSSIKEVEKFLIDNDIKMNSYGVYTLLKKKVIEFRQHTLV